MTAGTVVAIRRVTDRFAFDHDLPFGAQWAVVAYSESDNRPPVTVEVLDTDVDQDHLLAEARALAYMHHARFCEPDATCARCTRPVDVGHVYCPRESGRNCEAETGAANWSLLNTKPRPCRALFTTATNDRRRRSA